MVDMAQAVYDMMSKERKRIPCYTNRASGLGYYVPMLGGCVRRGVYERSHWDQRQMPDGKLLLVFEEGNRQERSVLTYIAKAGIDIIEQQAAFLWKEYELSGHIDGVYIDGEDPLPVEIKSMNPNIFARMFTLADFDKKPWTRAYKAQITVYMLMKNIDRAIFILKDKSTGQMRQIEVALDYDLGEACLATCEEINRHVKAATLPDQIEDREVCKKCPFAHICLPDIQLGEELKINDDPMFEHRLDRYLELAEAKKECEAEYRIIRSEAKAQAGESGELNLVVGNYHLTGRCDSRGSFRLKIAAICEET